MVLNKMDFVHLHPITIDISLKVEREENVGFVSCIGLFCNSNLMEDKYIYQGFPESKHKIRNNFISLFIPLMNASFCFFRNSVINYDKIKGVVGNLYTIT